VKIKERKICAKFVLQILTDEQEEDRGTTSTPVRLSHIPQLLYYRTRIFSVFPTILK